MNKLDTYFFILLGLISLVSLNVNAQTQIGQDIDGGYANDQSGTSISMSNASSIAIGEPFFGGSDGGRVVVYNRINNEWIQKGNAMYGESSDDRSGSAVSMPDENTVAIGAYLNDGVFGFADSYIGHVRVYEWIGSSWVQKGTDIDGENEYDRSGHSVCMPDENTVAIGAIWNDSNGSKSGHVRVFNWNGTAWLQKGIDIDGEAAFDNSGYSISMPDNNTIAIGAQKNDANASEDAGHVRIYNWTGTAWLQKGTDIDGETSGDLSGSSVSMPDVNTVAIGSPNNGGNGLNAGQVRVFQWNGLSWEQKGNDLEGENIGDLFGFSVSMPDANTLAAGAPNNDDGDNDAGQTRIFEWSGTEWLQAGADIYGEAAYDYSGQSIAMPTSSILAVAASSNDGVANNSGHVRVFSTCTPTEGVDEVNACGEYTWIDGLTYDENNTTATYTIIEGAADGCDSVATLNLTINAPTYGVHVVNGCEAYTWIDGTTYYDDNNTAIHTIVGGAANACDSIVTLDLTMNYTTFGIDEVAACGEYLWMDGNTYIENNNIATHTITNTLGCDSIVTLNLTIIDLSAVSDVVTACNSYTWVDGNTYTENNNTATWVLTNMAGCDSVVTLDLIINNSNSVTDVVTVCDSYIWIDGITYTESNNTATWLLTNTAGCDSVVALDLTITYSSATVDVNTACDSYTWIDGIAYTENNNTATWTISNAVGCDSIITLDLTIYNSSNEVDIITACDSYTWIDGNTYNEGNNTATYNYINSEGCDSVITLNLSIITINTLVNQEGPILMAEENAADYQWLKCPEMTELIDATEQIYTAIENGSFAVVIDQGGCVDTSICYTVEDVSISENEFGNELVLYPNPTEGDFTIDLAADFKLIKVKIKDITGRTLYINSYSDRNFIEFNWNHVAGVYFIELEADKQKTVLRLIKQ